MPPISAQTAQIALFIVTAGYGILLAGLLRSAGPMRHLKPERQAIARVTAFMVLAVLLAGDLLVTLLAWTEYYSETYDTMNSVQRASLDFYKRVFNSPYLVIPVALTAIDLFVLKRRQQAIYGVIELSAALALVFYVSITHQRTTQERAFAAVTALYFIIRGLDNVMNSPQIKQLTTSPATDPPAPRL